MLTQPMKSDDDDDDDAVYCILHRQSAPHTGALHCVVIPAKFPTYLFEYSETKLKFYVVLIVYIIKIFVIFCYFVLFVIFCCSRTKLCTLMQLFFSV